MDSQVIPNTVPYAFNIRTGTFFRFLSMRKQKTGLRLSLKPGSLLKSPISKKAVKTGKNVLKKVATNLDTMIKIVQKGKKKDFSYKKRKNRAIHHQKTKKVQNKSYGQSTRLAIKASLSS